MFPPPPRSTLFPYTTLFRSLMHLIQAEQKAKRGFSMAHHIVTRSEEHTSELQSQSNLVCRLLLEKKKHPHSARSAGANARPIPCRPAGSARTLIHRFPRTAS